MVAFGLAAAGASLLVGLPVDGNAAVTVLPGFVVLSLGIGGAVVTTTTSAMHHVHHAEAGLVSALVNTGHELGSALGVATASILAAGSLGIGATGVSGFRTAFAATAVLAASAALLGARLLPAGRPDPDAAPVFGH